MQAASFNREQTAGSRLTRVTGGVAVEGGQVRLLPGRLVPGTRYRLRRWLGEGGMGVVYEVEHEDIERRAAMKVLRVDRRMDPELAQQFRDEARAASKIGSDQIVEIYDFGELPDGRLHFTMEFLDGHSLVEELDDFPVSPARLVAIMRQAAKGLAAAHEAGIVHRDIKPENILLTQGKDGRPDRTKIVDFGIARIVSGDQVTEADAAGTPHYMAPELCTGTSYDARVDMYALGCSMYELIAGQPPFMGNTIEEVLVAHVDKEVVPPSKVGQVSYPEAIERVILRCLAKQPLDRYENMHELEAALCEAQIELGLETQWDDLPLPDVEPDRRAKIMAGMPNPEAALAAEMEKKRRWWVAVAGVAAIFLLSLVFAFMPEEPTVEEVNAVETVTEEARAAAARAYYVYPAPGDPYAVTAYRKVLELEESEELAADQLAQERAEKLRDEFSGTLARLGDRYWERPEGRPFAVEFYAMALMFDADHATARERVVLTPSELAEMRQQARDGTFSPGVLEAVADLQVIAAAGEDEEKALAELEKRDAEAPPKSLRKESVRRRLLRASGTSEPAPKVASAPRPKTIVPDEFSTPDGDTPAAPEPPPEPTVDAPSHKTGAPDDVRGRSERDPALSKRLTQEGIRSLKSRRLLEAETKFNQALAADHRNAAAQMGLSDVYFERSRYQQAVRYAERGVRLAPQNAGYRIRLGDAYFKSVRYPEAKAAYQKAKSLGSAAADARLAKVRRKLGG